MLIGDICHTSLSVNEHQQIENRSEAVRVKLVPSDVGAFGIGEARRAVSRAGWSNARKPNERATLTERTRPDASMVKAIATTPASKIVIIAFANAASHQTCPEDTVR